MSKDVELAVELVDDLRRRAEACDSLKDQENTPTANARLDGKAYAYRNAAELVATSPLFKPEPPSPDQALVEGLAGTLALARLKWGNLDPDANIIFERAEALIAKHSEPTNG